MLGELYAAVPSVSCKGLARAAREAGYEVARRLPIERRLTDEQIGERATAAFEAGARKLLRAGHIVPTKEACHG